MEKYFEIEDDYRLRPFFVRYKGGSAIVHAKTSCIAEDYIVNMFFGDYWKEHYQSHHAAKEKFGSRHWGTRSFIQDDGTCYRKERTIVIFSRIAYEHELETIKNHYRAY
jgi:hypothetical protein